MELLLYITLSIIGFLFGYKSGILILELYQEVKELLKGNQDDSSN